MRYCTFRLAGASEPAPPRKLGTLAFQPCTLAPKSTPFSRRYLRRA